MKKAQPVQELPELEHPGTSRTLAEMIAEGGIQICIYDPVHGESHMITVLATRETPYEYVLRAMSIDRGPFGQFIRPISFSVRLSGTPSDESFNPRGESEDSPFRTRSDEPGQIWRPRSFRIIVPRVNVSQCVCTTSTATEIAILQFLTQDWNYVAVIPVF